MYPCEKCKVNKTSETYIKMGPFGPQSWYWCKSCTKDYEKSLKPMEEHIKFGKFMFGEGKTNEAFDEIQTKVNSIKNLKRKTESQRKLDILKSV